MIFAVAALVWRRSNTAAPGVDQNAMSTFSARRTPRLPSDIVRLLLCFFPPYLLISRAPRSTASTCHLSSESASSFHRGSLPPTRRDWISSSTPPPPLPASCLAAPRAARSEAFRHVFPLMVNTLDDSTPFLPVSTFHLPLISAELYLLADLFSEFIPPYRGLSRFVTDRFISRAASRRRVEGTFRYFSACFKQLPELP